MQLGESSRPSLKSPLHERLACPRGQPGVDLKYLANMTVKTHQRTAKMTRGQAIYRDIHEDILSGKLRPDSKLILQDLCAAYSTSMSPVREALSHLVSNHLVRLTPQSGYWVASASLADFADLAQTRIELECDCLRTSIRHGGEEWEVRVLAASHRLRQVSAVRKSATPELEWEARHREFHVAVVDACGSPWKLRILESLLDHFDRYRRIAGTIATAATGLSVSHDMLSDAVMRRDAESAAAMLTLHINQTTDTVTTALADRLSDA